MNLPRDLLQLQRFMTASNNNNNHYSPVKVKVEEGESEEIEEEEEELELTLGLSMNGRFGVDPTAKKIKRTSSIPEFMMDRKEEIGVAAGCGGFGGGALARTCSLPAATEEEWRRRKEMQTLRRKEARRKRSEKQRNSNNMRVVRERSSHHRDDDVIGERDFCGGPRTTSLGSGLLPPFCPSSVSKTTSNGSDVISQSETQQASGINLMIC